MRDIWLVAWVALGVGFTFRFPFVGVLIWEWFSLMNPHREAFGFSQNLPLNMIIALATLVSWVISKEPKRIPSNPIVVVLAMFLVWMTFNSFFAFNPTWSWPFWDRTWRVLLLGFLITTMATNKARIDAVIWVAVISLLYFGVKGGLFTVLTGGTYKVLGPESTIIADNNQLALALLMAIPLVEYLRSNTSFKPLSWLLASTMIFTAISIIGSYSRGAYIAMAAIALMAWFKARRKFAFLGILVVAGVAIYHFTPQEIIDRAASIQSADSDASFHGRWVAWQVAIKYATDHFPLGGFLRPPAEWNLQLLLSFGRIARRPQHLFPGPGRTRVDRPGSLCCPNLLFVWNLLAVGQDATAAFDQLGPQAFRHDTNQLVCIHGWRRRIEHGLLRPFHHPGLPHPANGPALPTCFNQAGGISRE